MIAESTDARPEPKLVYQGAGLATEIWGVTQANFIIESPGRHSRELAVNVGLPVGTFMAGQVGVEETPEFRERAAAALGECWLRELHAAGRQVDAVETVSMDLLNRQPALLDCALAKLKAS